MPTLGVNAPGLVRERHSPLRARTAVHSDASGQTAYGRCALSAAPEGEQSRLLKERDPIGAGGASGQRKPDSAGDEGSCETPQTARLRGLVTDIGTRPPESRQ